MPRGWRVSRNASVAMASGAGWTGAMRRIAASMNPALQYVDAVAPGKVPPGPILLPTQEHVPHDPTSTEGIESAINDVASAAEAWRALSNAAKARLLDECALCLEEGLEEMAVDSVARKGSAGSGLGDEMLQLMPAMNALYAYAAMLRADGAPKAVATTKRGDRYICDVYPQGLENILFGGAHAEVWIKRGEEPSQGRIYRDGTVANELPGLACLLAAGNHACVAVRDAMHVLFACHCLVIIKTNPCNDWTGPHLERMLGPLVNRGFVRIVYGGADVAQALVHDSRVTRVHMTGSTSTYNAIVWGDPNGPAPGKTRLVTKPFEAELGCVTPYIVIPTSTPWTAAELRYQAMTACMSMITNSGHNCNGTEIIVTAKHWPQREAFLNAVRAYLQETSQRYIWYPGSAEKHAKFQRRFKKAVELGTDALCSMTACTSPFLLARSVDPAAACKDEETWGPCLQEVPLDIKTRDGCVPLQDFLDAAAAFANDELFGTLSCGVAVHPSLHADAPEALHAFVASLRYGCVGINVSPALCFNLPQAPWGAHAAAGTPEDIGSGNVLTHSTMYDHAEKAVAWYPFTMYPKPLWLPGFTNMEAAVRRLARFYRQRNVLTLALLMKAAFGSQ